MKRTEYEELMYLSVYGEVTEEEQEKLDAYLKKHPEMKKEFQKLKDFRSFVSNNTSKKTSDDLLHDARTQLRSALRNERNKRSVFSNIFESLSEFIQPKFAFGGVGLVALGMLIGYYSLPSKVQVQEPLLLPVSNESSSPDMTRIDNVRFIDSDASDGEVEFEFDAVAPMHLKGKIGDPHVQKILTHALLNESNAGVRLKTVNAMAQQTDEKKSADPAIKSALITALKSDDNPGVRREALRVLQQYEFDSEIRDALLHVLSHDANVGMRVAAINAMEIARMDGKKFDATTMTALKQQIQKEQNNYIRNRAVNLVEEIYQ